MRSRGNINPLERPIAVMLATILALAVMAPAGPVEALETGVCRIEVLVDGKPLTEYPARGTTYIEALHGHEYALRLTNLIDRRIAVALAVDGLNSIDAKTTSASMASISSVNRSAVTSSTTRFSSGVNTMCGGRSALYSR